MYADCAWFRSGTKYTVTATPFPQKAGGGTPFSDVTISFSIIAGPAPPSPPAPVAGLPTALIPAPSPAPISAPGVNLEVLINCGGPTYTDSKGRIWLADQYFTGGGVFSKTTSDVRNTTDDTVSRTRLFRGEILFDLSTLTHNDALQIYYTERNGDFFYQIPLPSAEFSVKIHMAEIVSSPTGHLDQVLAQCILSTFR